MVDRGKSYAEAVDILRTNKLREDRGQVLQTLRSLQRDKKFKLNMIVNLEYIKCIAKEFAEGKRWLCNFEASSSWARDIRLEFQKYKPCHLKNSRSKHFKQLIGWVKEKMHETEELSYDTTKAKYEEIFGKKCKKWTNTANRIRKRLSLDFKCVNERFKGSRGRSRVRKQYYFIAKEEWGNLLPFGVQTGVCQRHQIRFYCTKIMSFSYFSSTLFLKIFPGLRPGPQIYTHPKGSSTP